MVKKDEIREEVELAHRREKYIEYQNRRKEKLDKLGGKKLSIRLDEYHYDKLIELCEILGYRRPAKGKYNLIETYSGVMKYLLRISDSVTKYIPKTEGSQELLHLHLLVSHLKHELNLSDQDILKELKNKGIKTPLSSLENTVKSVKRNEFISLDNKTLRRDIYKFVEDLSCEEKIVEKMTEIDKDPSIVKRENYWLK
ncbi:TPA: hypothetical protein ACXI8I_003345 [Serratia marcescens]